MNRIFRSVVFVALITGLAMTLAKPAQAQTRLGLHVTQEELNIWKQRAQSGPYKSAGDVQSNSPGDWTRVNSNATSFRNAGNTSERWIGQPAGSCWSRFSPTAVGPARNQGEKIRDTAFRYLINGDTNDRDAVLAGLLDQASQPGTNWTDSVRWNNTYNCL